MKYRSSYGQNLLQHSREVAKLCATMAAELGINIVRQGFEDKLPVAIQVIEQLNLEPSQVCYIGDDLTDIAVIQHVGLGAAVSNAVEEVRQVADCGRGAVAERGGQ